METKVYFSPLPDSDGDIEDDNYEDNEAWKKHLPKFQRGMCCEDHVDCDRHNVSLMSDLISCQRAKRVPMDGLKKIDYA